MPKEGAAILSQVEGLLEQFMALDYETPEKEGVRGMLEQVRANLQSMRADDDAPRPNEAEEPEPPRENSREGGFKAAREAAMKDNKERGDFFGRRKGPRSDEDTDREASEEEDDKKRKRAKAF